MSIRTRTSGILININVEPAAAAYTGPGDIISGASGWYGLRAYSAAAIGQNCLDITFSGDSHVSTYQTIAGGGLPLSTISADQTTHGGTMSITKLYNQSGGGAPDLDDTNTVFPVFSFSALGSLPGILTTVAATSQIRSTGNITQAQPFQFSVVVSRTGNFTHRGQILGGNAGGNKTAAFLDTTNSVVMDAGADLSATAADSAFHAIQWLFSGASSEIYVDGSATATGNAGTNGFSAEQLKMGAVAAGNDATIMEVGIWAGTFSAGTKTSLNANQHNYYGF